MKETLATALEHENAGARADYLDETCAGDSDLRREIDVLLAHPPDAFECWAEEGGFLRSDSSATKNEGRRIGAYRLVRELGRGGMGAVWLATRADEEFHQTAAIKLLKRGTDTDEVLRRFRAEREILARLQHPNIARLLDGGTTDDSLPYFIMEYVEGIRLTDFVSQNNLSLGARLRLFSKICAAVQFAHQNLIVHRDLKPANILVTAEGEPKLLDFGIAKLLASDTEVWEATIAGRERLTPGYASPEQVLGEPITTVSDVYSLGALLYEILCARPPHAFQKERPSPTELMRVICQEEPARPSLAAAAPEMRRALRGDLETIILRAMSKEPARRYAGAGELADDLHRYEEGRPVRAQRDTVGYRFGKFVRRNKLGVAVILLILAGSVATAWQAHRAEHQKALADDRFNQVRQLAHSVLFDYHDQIAALPGSTKVRERLVKDALAYLDRLSKDAASDK
ncbi:MAG: serine/threonine protein kinase, partial [Verrucomicrobiota bacterium]|nr:serine/threonine protein kinase [Verrucomicrobiota bacterium]